MTAHSQSLDLGAAKSNPSKYFDTPQDVLVHPRLSRTAKLDILRAWEVDARLLATAEDENMAAGESSHLGAVVSALIALGDEDKEPHYERPRSPAQHSA